MRTNVSIVVAAYVRLSVDEAGKSVSGSIENQISLIKEYCAKRELIVAAVFQDDGWSGGNFERPGFKKLLEFLRKKSANTVITVDDCVIIEPTQKDLENQGFVAGSICFLTRNKKNFNHIMQSAPLAA